MPNAERRPADVEMARVLKTAPLRMASDPSNGMIAHWKHGALHDIVEPMTDHVVMTYAGSMQRLERRSGTSVAIGTARTGVVTIIPAGSSRPMGHSRACQRCLSSIFHTQHSNALRAKPIRRHRAIFSSEQGIPTPLHPDCS